MTTAMQVATYLRHQRTVFGEMQLQKLLYYAQAWTLAWTGKPLFVDEIEAWANGPVVRTVWAAGKYDEVVPPQAELSDAEREIVDAVYAFYGDAGGMVLGARTHTEEPWIEARHGLPKNAMSSSPLSQSTMLRYFTKESVGQTDCPKRPVRVIEAAPDAVAAAGNRQAHRWRDALDALANR
jgi:uncharacterized phage-associated protein